MGLHPIAYWPMWEAVGLTAHDIAPNAYDGTYQGVTLAEPGVGDGSTCPFFDGANDYCNITVAGFLAAFNGSEGTVAGFLRVANAGVWTDATERRFVRVEGPGGYILLRRTNANNILNYIYNAGGVTETVNLNTAGNTAWMHIALTWSASADEVRAYYDGVQTGATQGTLGVFGAAPTLAMLGAESAVPARVWHGWMAHWAFWNTALTPTQIATLALVP